MLGRAGERAAHVAEELALEERLDDRGAVDRDEPLRAARPQLVQRARDQLLARARLAGDERRPDVRRQAANQTEDVLHRRTAPDHAAEFEPLREVAFHRQHLAALRGFIANRGKQVTKTLQVERLGEVIERAELDRFHRAVDGGKAGHQDDLALRAHVANRAEHVEAGDAGHPQVEEDKFGRALAKLLHRLFTGGGRRHVEAFGERDRPNQGEDRAVIVDHEQPGALVLHFRVLPVRAHVNRVTQSRIAARLAPNRPPRARIWA